MPVLEEEIATYREHLPELLEHEGKWVVIQGTTVFGVFEDYVTALTFGHKNLGLQRPFLVREILETERVHLIG